MIPEHPELKSDAVSLENLELGLNQVELIKETIKKTRTVVSKYGY